MLDTLKPEPDISQRRLLHELQQDSLTKEALTGHGQKGISKLKQYLPLTAIIVSSVLAILLLVADAIPLRFSSNCQESTFACAVENDRATVAVVVQIIGTILAILWTFSVSSVFNLVARLRLANRQNATERIRLCVSLSRRTVDLSLPLSTLLISITFYCLTLLPPWLWTGCLTPRVVYVSSQSPRNVSLPDMSAFQMPGPSTLLNTSCIFDTAESDSNCPDIAEPSDLITTLSSSSYTNNVIGSTQLRANGRSFGVGSTAAYFQTDSSLISATYNETGLMTQASCSYNGSADWHIAALSATSLSKDAGVSLYWANGKRPNDDWLAHNATQSPGYLVWDLSMAMPDTVVAFSAGSSGSSRNGTSPYQLSVAAGQQYNFLNQAQCDLSFAPAVFGVLSNFTNAVLVVGYIDNAPSLSQQSGIIEMALRRLQGLTQVETTLYSSAIGAALSQRCRNYQAEYTPRVPFDPTTPQLQSLACLEAAIEDVMDGILMALANYILTVNSTSTTAILTIQYIVIGTPSFHWALAVINFVALITIIVVMIWTTAFKDSSVFDFSDLISMVIAAHNGSHEPNISWNGNSRDRKLNNVQLVVEQCESDGLTPCVRVVHEG